MAALVVDRISRSYPCSDGGQETIYAELSLIAQQGLVTLISGESGCGKSSLLRQIALIDPCQSGEIELLGRQTSLLSCARQAKLRAQHIGFIFQSFALIEEFSVVDNCALPLVMNGHSFSSARHKARQLLAQYLPGLAPAKRPNELSGGQQQRVAMVRAIIHHPQIIIADEPTGNLDVNNAVRVKTALIEMAEKMNSAVIIVSHDAQFIDIAQHHYAFVAANDGRVKSRLQQVL